MPQSISMVNSSNVSFELEIAQLIISAVKLKMAADEIKPTEPLFGEGLGLDSIDVLEIALAISKRYGMQLRSDNENNAIIFASLRNLSAYVAQNRTK